MRDALKLAGWAALGYLAWQWLQGQAASAAPPPAVEPPTTPPVVPPTPAKVPWPKGGAAERARAMGFSPRSSATPAQRERAWSHMSDWTPDSVWPDPSDPGTLYVAAYHGTKKGVEVWGRKGGAAPVSPGTDTARKLVELADAGRVSTSPGILRALAATAATMGPRGQALAAELAAKAAAIEAAGAA